jgi:catechol 2,3-dioxygenase-like lactoylglutathione lyase family enzyme
MIQYGHTNIITDNWQQLAQFYINVFGCKPFGKERDLKGEWLNKGTAIENANIKGIHLSLPGYGDNAPTLEIFQYTENLDKPSTVANRKGFGHIAFKVDDVAAYTQKVLENGGSMVGEIVNGTVEGEGDISFVYVTDPDGNMIELQKWG